MPARPMRKATYEAGGEAGPAEIAVYYFGPGQGGGVEENITRWIGQFKDLPSGAAERSAGETNGFATNSVYVARGIYLSGMPGQRAKPKEDWALRASIVQTPHGHYFFKMTGPAQTVEEQKSKFDELLSSVSDKQ